MAVLATKTPEGLDFTTKQEQSTSAADKQRQNSPTPKISGGQRLYTAKVKQAELIMFTTQLSVMLDSGVVLSDALDAIAEQAEHGTFKMIIMNVAETVKSGENFSKALAEYPKVFNSMFISMVKAS